MNDGRFRCAAAKTLVAPLEGFPSPTMTLTDLLARYPRIDSTAILREIPGGFSGRGVWRIESGGEPFALRRWPDDTRESRVDAVHSALAAIASRSGLPIALPIATRDGSRWTRWCGSIWEITPWLPGEPPRSRTTNSALVANAMRGLASFHAAARQLTTAMFGESSLMAERRGLARREITTIESPWDSIAAASRDPRLTTRANRVVDAARAWLPIVRADLDDVPAGPLHWILRDVWRSNLLVEGDRLSGLIDFDAMRIDSPSADIARLLGSLASCRAVWEAGLAAYHDVLGLSVDDARRILAFQRSGILLSALNWLRWLVVERRSFNDTAAALRRWDEWIDDLEWGPAEFAWIGDRSGWRP